MSSETVIDSTRFRQVLGHYPTGVCAITSVADDGVHAAMVVGTFSSVSLDPPLVGFFPDKKSGSWAQIQQAGRFCVNILSSDQGQLCRQFASRGDKYADVDFSLSPTGSPIVAGAIAWIDCTIENVVDAGDHYLVLGRVQALDAVRDGDPMLFYRGKYGGFADLEAL